MLKTVSASFNHEELFLERYDQLFRWSLQLTGNDHEVAEDLLHDLFIQFTLRQPPIGAIGNLEGYLYVMLRNLHLAHERRANRNRLEQLSIVEYDSAEIGLRTVDPRDQIYAQDELRCVCTYACQRKETAKLASVLILRFFHNYYPGEIAQIMCAPRAAVDKLLRLARGEARASLRSPESLGFLRPKQIGLAATRDFARRNDDFLNELRESVFQSRNGDCLSEAQLSELYRRTRTEGSEKKAVVCAVLAHLVGCASCLDRVNRLLGLAVLAERYGTDAVSQRASRKRQGRGGRGGKGGTGAGPAQLITRLRRRAKDLFQHRPQELCVSVNGYTLGSQRISSECSELNLVIDRAERINFIEVFSDQKMRLMLLCLDEPPPNGPGEEQERLVLSDERSLEVKLRYTSPSPTLQVVYVDPSFSAPDEDLAALALAQEPVAPGDEPASELEPTASATSRETLAESLDVTIKKIARLLPSLVRTLPGRLFNPLRLGTVTALFAALLVAVTLLVSVRRAPPRPSVAQILQNASHAEAELGNDQNRVTHRKINFEERISKASACDGCGELIARRQIEVWQSAEKRMTARRLYDENGRLIAGDWRRADGIQLLYHHGAKPLLKTLNPVLAIRTFDDVWQLSPSAKDFIALIGEDAATHVEARSDAYVISAEVAKSEHILKATLTLSRADLRAIEQTLTLKQGNEIREYRMLETLFEIKANSEVVADVFEPDKELLSATAPNIPSADTNTPGVAVVPNSPSPLSASAALEVEVLGLLNQAGADMGEQITVTRTPAGRLTVQGITETDKRKHELLSVLGPVAKNPAVKIDIQTLDEALSRQPKNQPSTNSISIESSQASASALPVDKELRQYLATRSLSGTQTDEAIRQFSNRTIHRSLQILKHASALKSLAQRFSPEQLQNLDPDPKTKWLLLVRQHAQAVQQETTALERELSQIFPGMASSDIRQSEIDNSQELVQAIERLFASCSENDRAISAAFTISLDASRGSAIKSPPFWRSLKSTESLAARIVEFRF